MANKAELVKAVAEKTGFTKKDSANAVNAVFGALQDIIANGDKISLVGFGSFGTVERSERTGRNPQTGEPMTIPARTVPYFKAGKALKEAVNK